MTGLVSTIIPVYNRAEMIRTAVQSVLDQTYRPIEIILVDDGSTDDTWAELQRLEAEHPAVIRIAQRENGGPGLARETGRLLARGEFIQYFDSDDLLLPRKFEVQVAALREHPECGIAYCRSSVIDAMGRTIYEPCKWTGRKMEFLFPALLVDRWWNTHTPLYRYSLCDEIGSWVAQRPEDWDYDARIGATGTHLVFCDEILSCQRQHEGPCVTKSSLESYIPQEALFLPRLYDCAVKAGISLKAPEMKHFSRWAFTHARHAAMRGDLKVMEEMLGLSDRAGNRSVDFRLFKMVKKVLGGRIALQFYRIVRVFCWWDAGKRTLKASWDTSEV